MSMTAAAFSMGSPSSVADSKATNGRLMMSARNTSLDVNEKLKIINALKGGKSRKEVMEEFNVPKTTICRIVKKATMLEEQLHEGHGNNKRISKPAYPKLENYVATWLKECRYNNTPITGTLIKKKAKTIAVSLGIEGFGASNGWLDKFKKRHSILFPKLYDEENAAAAGAALVTDDDCLDETEYLDMYEADESYFYLPNEPFTFENSQWDEGSCDFDPSLSEEEKRFYSKAYPTVDIVRDRKVHCTVCKTHIGTAPVQETGIKMHPILRVTHCTKCHDFYNSGEFSKGEDGSELYCRWCGQGGEVYCCSSCPYVFCKSCIVKNLSRGVVADIEQNENWNCFSCAPKILWPLRAQHWALINYIDQQKKEAFSLNLSESETKLQLQQDRSKCCRLAKAKCGNMSDSMESLDSVTSKRSSGSGSAKKAIKHNAPSPQLPNAKRAKNNEEMVCTPDLLSMLEPDCQITVPQKNNQRPMISPITNSPRTSQPMQQQQQSGYAMNNMSTPRSSAPPPLVLRNTGIKVRPTAQQPIVRRTVIGPRAPVPGGGGASPVYHTINGYRIDLNTAAQQETFRLPNGKLIQVKRQGPPPGSSPMSSPSTNNSWQQQISGQQQQQQQPTPQQLQRVVPQTIASRPVQITPHSYSGPNMPQHPQVLRYQGNVIGSTTINAIGHNGTPLQAMNGQISSMQSSGHMQQNTAQQSQTPGAPVRPVMVRHIFPDTPIGQARTQLQEQVFNAMEICTHLTNKVQTLTNSNAYKQAKNYLEVKELYIHLSYLLTYAVGRFKGLQDKCLADMRSLGFGNDADSLENGQLAAAIDYVCYGQLDDVDLFNTGSNSFHNQVYEYRKSLHANLKDGEDGAKSPLPPLFALGEGKSDEPQEDDDGEDSLLEAPKEMRGGNWLESGGAGGEDSPNPGFAAENEENEEPDESYFDNDDDDNYNRSSMGGFGSSFVHGTEESMRRNEETHAYDRKLTRLVSQYPSIWCTRHPDYGNFEVTRKQWRTITAHFDRGENIKLRWKNIRKRFVRIEKRIAEGKRFNGHFDKAMAFLANRDLPTDQWVEVDCGEDDGDTFDRQNLDAIEQSLHRQGKDEGVDRSDRNKDGERNLYNYQATVKPIEIEPLDLKIITFVKTNPVLWRKSMDPEADKIDEQTRSTVWKQLQKTLKTISSDYVRDRWQHLYEMYKTFRLKTIKSTDDRSNLELKYSKYLAKLYFLYKIDEHELRNENNGLFEDCFELEEDEEAEREAEAARTAGDNDNDSGNSRSGIEDENDTATPSAKLQDMPDDKEFLEQMVQHVKEYPAIWDTHHEDYNDIMIRDNYWQEIHEKLAKFKHKQASDDEDNEIEIVEPKTDTITLDSDDDEPPPTKIIKTLNASASTISALSTPPTVPKIAIQKIYKQNVPTPTPPSPSPSSNYDPSSLLTPLPEDDGMDLMSMAQSFLASMLEVDIHEGTDPALVKKQPRKKTTNKPNPTLLKQKAMMERERLEEMKRNDLKLKMKCAVKLTKAEDQYPLARRLLEAKAKEKELREQLKLERQKEKELELEKSSTLLVDTGGKTIEVKLVLEDDNVNTSTPQKKSNGTEAIIDINEEDGGTPQKRIILIKEESMSPIKHSDRGKSVSDEEKSTEKTKDAAELTEKEDDEKPKENSDKDKGNDSKDSLDKTIDESLEIVETENKDNCVEILDSSQEEDKDKSLKDEISNKAEKETETSKAKETGKPLNKTQEAEKASKDEASEAAKSDVSKTKAVLDDSKMEVDDNDQSKQDSEKGETSEMEVDDDEKDGEEEEVPTEEDAEDLTDEGAAKDKIKEVGKVVTTKEDAEEVATEEDAEDLTDEVVSKDKTNEVSKEVETKKVLKDVKNADKKLQANEDLEDAEVYKEIEKVLQQNRDEDEKEAEETPKEKTETAKDEKANKETAKDETAKEKTAKDETAKEESAKKEIAEDETAKKETSNISDKLDDIEKLATTEHKSKEEDLEKMETETITEKPAAASDTVKESSKDSIKESAKDSIKESASESIKESAKESIKEPSTESIKETAKESIKETAKESLKDSAKESLKDSATESVKEPAKVAAETSNSDNDVSSSTSAKKSETKAADSSTEQKSSDPPAALDKTESNSSETKDKLSPNAVESSEVEPKDDTTLSQSTTPDEVTSNGSV